MSVQVNKIDETTYEVSVAAKVPTKHTVTVSVEYWRKLTGGKTTAEDLVAKSFEFLLEREPNTSILRSFDLPVIGSYFPEYEKTIAGML